MTEVNEPDWLLRSPSTVTPQAAAAARSLVERRLTGSERAQVLSMLFDAPHSRRVVSPSRQRDGDRLPEEARARIRDLIATGLGDSAIADEVGVSRQAVTGVRSQLHRGARATA